MKPFVDAHRERFGVEPICKALQVFVGALLAVGGLAVMPFGGKVFDYSPGSVPSDLRTVQ